MAKLLVVEDDPGYQELMPALLSGHDVAVCSSAEEARTRLDHQSFDALICDIELLGMTGLEFLREIKARGLTEKMPVIMCSSLSTPHVRQLAMDGGAAGYIPKPFDPAALVKLMQTLLAR